ncbi:MAG: hypothetical protein DI601_24525 [Azospirillum brasilense]|nr:MAG: hypothetical protein DI601_24525 [Azospirillum brasilense]
MWTAITRAERRREGLLFPGDLTDAEWAVVEPLLPSPSRVGRTPDWPLRELLDAIFYVLRGSIALLRASRSRWPFAAHASKAVCQMACGMQWPRLRRNETRSRRHWPDCRRECLAVSIILVRRGFPAAPGCAGRGVG